MSSTAPVRPALKYNSLAEIETRIVEFEACQIPREEWTHHAHLTMALWYLHRYPADAVEHIRAGIQRYNQASSDGTQSSIGYHETITLFWTAVLRQHLSDVARQGLVFVVNQLASGSAHKDLILTFYSRARLFSDAARAQWVPPDLKPLPAVEER
jgi:hypothetical protein